MRSIRDRFATIGHGKEGGGFMGLSILTEGPKRFLRKARDGKISHPAERRIRGPIDPDSRQSNVYIITDLPNCYGRTAEDLGFAKEHRAVAYADRIHLTYQFVDFDRNKRLLEKADLFYLRSIKNGDRIVAHEFAEAEPFETSGALRIVVYGAEIYDWAKTEIASIGQVDRLKRAEAEKESTTTILVNQ